MLRRALCWLAGLAALDAAIYRLLGPEGGSALDWLSALLVLDTLIVVWWYTSLTHELATAARSQANASEEQLRLLQAQREDERRPCVVIDWSIDSAGDREAADCGKYKARNIGQGIAVNVVHVDTLDGADPTVTHIGALGSGASVSLPADLNRRLCEDHVGRQNNYLIADSAGSDLWVISRNVRQVAGRISHVVSTRQIPDRLVREIRRQSLDDYLKAHWTEVQKELAMMLDELRGGTAKQE